MVAADEKPERPVVHVLGARPNFVKAAPVVAAMSDGGRRQVVLHTGQHYDERMSDVFFRQLALPTPDLNLGVGSGSHAAQTATLLVKLEEQFEALDPALVVVYGDVNSTLAAALVGAKTGVPLAHVEAGLRSFDMTMPEEVNRRVTDQLSELCFVTSPEAVGHLRAEGIAADRIHFVGNPMIDTLLRNLDRFDVAAVREQLGLPQRYVTATLHRPANVDRRQDARELVEALHAVADEVEVVLPLHPRGRATLEAAGLFTHPRVLVVEPLGYIEFLSLIRGSLAVLTDSGGVQEETTVLRVPCLTLRPNTERPVTVTHGSNRLVERTDLLPQLLKILSGDLRIPQEGPPLWDGHAGPRIAGVIDGWLRDRATGHPQ